jgi:hypothetical protein
VLSLRSGLEAVPYARRVPIGSFHSSDWLEHHYFRTYQIAGFAEDVATNPFAYITDLLQGLIADDGIVGFLRPWQKWTALHGFVAFISEALFDADLDGLRLMVVDGDGPNPVRALPVDYAMGLYGFSGTPPFVPPAEIMSQGLASGAVQDAYYEHFLELKLTGALGELSERIADEVFYVLFQNRTALSALHRFLATQVDEIDPEGFALDAPEIAALFSRPGVLRRVEAPGWAKKAVYFREQGPCATCGADVTGLLDPITAGHYDHIVPLAEGGLNDVSNLQLLCAGCNLKKGSRTDPPARYYRRWYQL